VSRSLAWCSRRGVTQSDNLDMRSQSRGTVRKIIWRGQPVTKIFINYRRDDTQATAGGIHDSLGQAFGRDNVFMDVDNIRAGEKFADHLNAQVEKCDIFLSLIGPNWLDASEEDGTRRLDAAESSPSISIRSNAYRSASREPRRPTATRSLSKSDTPTRTPSPSMVTDFARSSLSILWRCIWPAAKYLELAQMKCRFATPCRSGER